MANNIFIADDGTIHRITENTFEPQISEGHNYQIVNNLSSVVEERHDNSEKQLCFWVLSSIISFVIGICSYLIFGQELFGKEDDLLSVIGPIVMVAGSVIGNILYVRCIANNDEYSFQTYIYAVLASIAGVICSIIGVVVISYLVVLLFYLLIVVLAIALVFAFIE